MKLVNESPIFADFGNADEDGAIRLITRGTQRDLKEMHINLVEGSDIWLTDNDVEVVAKLALRDGMWVAIPNADGYKPVPLSAPHHISNL